MNCYLFIETVTQAMKNRMVRAGEPKKITIDSVEYNILEISREDLISSSIFDTYVWYSVSAARFIKETEAFP